MGRHHCALRSRPRPPAQRLPMGRRYPAGRSRADAEPEPARSLWRLRFGPASRWRSRFHTPEAPTTWLRACGMQDLHLYVRSRFATSPAQIILPLPGCSPTTARLVAWVRLRCFRLAFRRKEGPWGFDPARPSVCRYRGSSCGRYLRIMGNAQIPKLRFRREVGPKMLRNRFLQPNGIISWTFPTKGE